MGVGEKVLDRADELLEAESESWLPGQDPDVSTLNLGAGDLNVFKGKNTAHRVTPLAGDLMRIISVFSYYETPGRMFSDEENIGFYGRTAS